MGTINSLLENITNNGSITDPVTIYPIVNNSSNDSPPSYTLSFPIIIPSATVLMIISGTTFTINSGQTVTVESGGTIDNSGVLANSGTTSNYGALINDFGGNIQNNGIINNYCGATYTPHGTFSGNPIVNKCPDTKLPIVGITSPSNNAVLNSGTFSFNGFTSDTQDSITGVSVSLDFGAFSSATTTNNFANWSFPVSGLSNGPHTVTAKATDQAGNVGTTSESFTVAPPSSTIQSSNGAGPIIFSTSSGGFTGLSSSATLGSGIQAPGGTYPYGFFSWTLSGFSGNTATVTITFPGPVPLNSKWVKASGASITPILVSGNPDAISITIQDNGPFDENPTAGVISDPAGLMVPTNGSVTGGGKIEDKANFAFEVHSDLDSKKSVTGNLEYQDKLAKFKLDSDKVSFLSVDKTASQATFIGQTTNEDDDHGKKSSTPMLTFMVSITDPDKTGNHDTFTITVNDSSGKTVYHNSGTIKGHVEVHKLNDKETNVDNTH